MYKKGITEIESMLMREHKAEGGMLGKKMPMMVVKKKVAIEPKMMEKKKGGHCKKRAKKFLGGMPNKIRDAALGVGSKMLEGAKNARQAIKDKTGFAAGGVGKVRKGQY